MFDGIFVLLQLASAQEGQFTGLTVVVDWVMNCRMLMEGILMVGILMVGTLMVGILIEGILTDKITIAFITPSHVVI